MFVCENAVIVSLKQRMRLIIPTETLSFLVIKNAELNDCFVVDFEVPVEQPAYLLFELVNKGEEACSPRTGQLISRVSQHKDDIVSFVQTMPKDIGDHWTLNFS